MDVSWCQEQDEGPAFRIADSVELGVAAPLGAADAMGQGPPFPPPAEFDDSTQAKSQAKEYLRRYLEVAPDSSKGAVWLKLAGRCRSSEDATGEIHALCEAALLSSSKAEDLGRYANRLNGRIRELKSEKIEEAWSPEVRDLLHRVIGKMESYLEELTATDCSRLSWLYLNVGNDDRARDIARFGIEREPENDYCLKVVEKLDG